MFHKKLAVLTLILFLAPGLSWAADYKNWLPHLPDQLDGLKATSNGDGMNFNSGDGGMSQLTKIYGSGKKEISISISYNYDSSEQTQDEAPMEQMNMETSAMVMKTLKVQGFDTLYQYLKDDNSAIISISLNGKATVMFVAIGSDAKGEKHYIGLLDKINLKKIYATL